MPQVYIAVSIVEHDKFDGRAREVIYVRRGDLDYLKPELITPTLKKVLAKAIQDYNEKNGEETS